METIKSPICGREFHIFRILLARDAIVRRSSETENRAAVSTALWHSASALFAYNPPLNFYGALTQGVVATWKNRFHAEAWSELYLNFSSATFHPELVRRRGWDAETHSTKPVTGKMLPLQYS